jgi:hypothetical protein
MEIKEQGSNKEIFASFGQDKFHVTTKQKAHLNFQDIR